MFSDVIGGKNVVLRYIPDMPLTGVKIGNISPIDDYPATVKFLETQDAKQ